MRFMIGRESRDYFIETQEVRKKCKAGTAEWSADAIVGWNAGATPACAQ